MMTLAAELRRTLSRWLSRLLIAVGGHDMKVRLLRRSGMRIGDRCRIYTDHFGGEPFLISIGDHCTITSGVRFVTHDGSCWVLREEIANLQDFGPIVVEDNCFIGVNAVLLPNVRIGRNSIVAAGSVVSRDVPPDTVVGGVPARPISTLEEFKRKKISKRDALRVPTDAVGRRRFLEDRFREVLERPASRDRS